MQKAKVLVVEADNEILLYISNQLQAVGYLVETIIASDYATAIQQVHQICQSSNTIAIDIVVLGNYPELQPDSKSFSPSIYFKDNLPVVYLSTLPSLDIVEVRVAIELTLRERKSQDTLQVKKTSYRQLVEGNPYKSKATNRALLETIPDLLIRISRNGDYLDFIPSKDFRVLIPKNNMVGENIYEILPPYFAQRRMEYVQKALETGETQIYEYEIISAEQVTYYQEARIAKCGENEVLAIIRDISDRKRTEIALRDSQIELQQAYERLNSHVENSPVAFIESDKEFRVQRWSKKAELIFGWKAEEVIGKHPNEWLMIYEDDVEAVNLIIANLLNGTQPRSSSLNRNYTKDGSIIYCDWYNSVLFDIEGNPISVLSLVQDVTERVQSTEALQSMTTQLEERVERRTSELTNINKQLTVEIAEREQAEGNLYEHLETMSNLNNVVLELNGAETLEDIYTIALKGIQLLLKVDRVSILSYTSKQGLHFQMSSGLSKKYKRIVEAFFKLFKPIDTNSYLYPNLITSPIPSKRLRSLTQSEGIQALGCFHLAYQNVHFGKIVAYYNAPHEFTQEETQLAQTISIYISTAISRKQAELALQRNEELYRLTFEHVAVGVAYATLSGQFFKANSRYTEMLGYDNAELMSKTFIDITHPNDIDKDLQKAAQIASGEIDSFILEKRYIRKDGSIIWVNIFVSLVRDRNGLPLHTICVVEDIGDRKRAEEAVKIREQAIIASSNGIAIVDASLPNLPLVYVNPAFEKMTGYSSSEVLGRNCRFLLAKDLNQPEIQQLKAAIQKAESCTVNLRNYCKNGSLIWVKLDVSHITDDQGNVTHYVCILNDINDHMTVEIELRKAFEREKELADLRSQFISMVSHEFRTPLSSILLSTDLLQNNGMNLSDAKREQRFTRIRQGVKRMTELLEDVLMIGKVEARKLEFKPTLINIHNLCCELAEEILLSLDGHYKIIYTSRQIDRFTQTSVETRYHFQTGTLESSDRNAFSSQLETFCVYMDEKLLRHILLNLLSNALKYSPTNDTINFELSYFPSLELDGSGIVQLKVQDYGIGISEKDCAYLFENFYRGSNASNIHGTGLGLAIVKHSVELHGGKISVDSKVNFGTTFIVTIPVISKIK